MRKTKKALAILALIAMVLMMLPAQLFAADGNRIAGNDRYETAIKIAKEGWASAETVILAAGNNENLVDALAASSLAGQENAPILLTPKASLNKNVADAIKDLGAKKVYIIGAAQGLENAVKDLGVDVVVLAGKDRWETASKINAELKDVKGTFVVAYDGVADALSVGSYAAKNGFQIVLAKADGTVDSSVLKGDVYTVGGKVKSISGEKGRFAGNDRYDTNTEVVKGLDFSFDVVYVANGLTLADALAAAPLAAKANAAVLLASASDVKAASYVNEKLSANSKVIALGGTAAVSDSVLGKVAYKAPAAFAVVSVTAINAKQIQVKFNKAVDKGTIIDSSDNTLIDDVVELTRIPAGSDVNKQVTINSAFAKLSDDGTVLTITASGSEIFEGTYAIAINDSVRDKNGEYLTTYKSNFTANEDTVAPTVKSISYNAATDEIKVVMSEPVLVAPTITIDGGAPVAASPNTIKDTFTITNTAEAGSTITVLVSGAIDYNDNLQASAYTQSIKITYEESKIQLVSATQKSSNQVKLVFDKSLAKSGNESAVEAVIDASVTVLRSGVAQAFNSSFDADDDTNRTVILTFTGTGPDYPIYPEGKDTVNLTIVIGEDTLTDIFGNTNNEISRTVTMVKDKSGPVVSSIRLTNDKKAIELRFNENVNEVNVGDLAKLTVRKDGVIVSVTTGEGFHPADAAIDVNDKKIVTIPYYDASNNPAKVPNGNYTVRIDRGLLKDDHGNENAAIVSPVITVSHSDVSSQVTVVSIIDKNDSSGAVVGNNKYLVTFSGKVSDSALLPTAYTLNGVALPTNTDIVFTDTTKTAVLITLPSNSVNYSSVAVPLRVVNVKDTDGNKVATASFDVEVVDNVKPVLVSATLTGNTLQLTFSENMKPISVTDLRVLLADLEIKGNSILLQDLDGGSPKDDIVTTVDGKTITIVFTNTDPADNNWSIVKAASTITVKVKDDTLLADANETAVKTDVTVTVVKK